LAALILIAAVWVSVGASGSAASTVAAQGVCSDPALTSALTAVLARPPDGSGTSGECDPQLYGSTWTSPLELMSRVRTAYDSDVRATFPQLTLDHIERDFADPGLPFPTQIGSPDSALVVYNHGKRRGIDIKDPTGWSQLLHIAAATRENGADIVGPSAAGGSYVIDVFDNARSVVPDRDVLVAMWYDQFCTQEFTRQMNPQCNLDIEPVPGRGTLVMRTQGGLYDVQVYCAGRIIRQKLLDGTWNVQFSLPVDDLTCAGPVDEFTDLTVVGFIIERTFFMSLSAHQHPLEPQYLVFRSATDHPWSTTFQVVAAD
jgi:hypothetical protein